MQFVAGALCLSSVACSGSVNLVRPSKPHATLVISVAHGERSDALFHDLVLVDEQQIPVGTGEGGEVTVLVAPGKHDVRLVSLRQEQRLQIYDVAVGFPVVISGVGTTMLPVQRIEPSMQLGDKEVASCRHTLTVDAQPGQMIEAGLLYDRAGACRPEGA